MKTVIEKSFKMKNGRVCNVKLLKGRYEYIVSVDGADYYKHSNLTFATQRFNEI